MPEHTGFNALMTLYAARGAQTRADAEKRRVADETNAQLLADPQLRALQEATRELTLNKVRAESAAAENAMYEQQRAFGKQQSEESLQNALARQYQRKIEGGANVMTKTPEGVYTGVWQPEAEQEPYWAEGKMQVPQTREEQLVEVPEAARYAYDKYMGIPPEFGQKERMIKATEAKGKEAQLAAIEAKKEENELKREELETKRKELAIINEEKVRVKTLNEFGKAHLKAQDERDDDIARAQNSMNPEVATAAAWKEYDEKVKTLKRNAASIGLPPEDISKVLPEEAKGVTPVIAPTTKSVKVSAKPIKKGEPFEYNREDVRVMSEKTGLSAAEIKKKLNVAGGTYMGG